MNEGILVWVTVVVLSKMLIDFELISCQVETFKLGEI